ncbi:hypothetical protein HA402_004614 [Bradysia odoriphaga]|nr:hypothetical protein HA402_004614 [Bradysia odoriphaga]
MLIDIKTAQIGIDWRKFTSELFVSKEEADFVVIVSDKEKGDQEIKLHSYVLRSRIPDFANILKHDLKERGERIVRITDFSLDVINSFFEFAYCGTATNIEELACELLKVADKYNFGELKEICSEKIGKNLNVENAASVCSIAFFAQAEELLKLAKDFIMKPE